MEKKLKEAGKHGASLIYLSMVALVAAGKAPIALTLVSRHADMMVLVCLVLQQFALLLFKSTACRPFFVIARSLV